MASLLVATIFLPLVGVASIWALAPLGPRAVRWAALLVALTTLVMTAVLIANFPADGELDRPFAQTSVSWLGASSEIDVKLDVGLDGLSLWLFGLSALLTLTAVLVSWDDIRKAEPLYYSMLLLLECGCLGVFAAGDIILFYVFFEFTLIPLFFLIGIWGGQQRRYAAAKFFLFTLTGSLLTFLGLLAIVLVNYQATGVMTFSIAGLTGSLAETPIPQPLDMWIFVALMAGFAIKVPLVPFHTWLPLAHVEAPTAGSVLLAGVLLKIGAYGFVRFSLSMLPGATAACTGWLLWLSVIGIIYGGLVALAQRDMKRLIAYSSVSHLGFCMLGVFALNRLGMEGGVLQLINHGISTGALFAIVGMIYRRYHTRQISELGGLSGRLPWLAFFMLLFALSSIGLPGLGGFAGEFLLLVGMFQRGWADAPLAIETQLRVISVLALSGVVLGAWYMLWLVERVFFGPLKEPSGDEPNRGKHTAGDLSPREVAALVPLAVFVLWIGLQPKFFLDRMHPTLEKMTHVAADSFDERHGSARSTAGLADTLAQTEPHDD